MRVRITDSAEQAGQLIADDIAARLTDGSVRVLGVATGASPLPIYRSLAARGVGYPGVELVALDEYVGTGSDDPRSFSAYVAARIARPLQIPVERTHVPSGDGRDPDAAAAEFERLIERIGPVDLQILGVGTNGHIGFNEPGSDRASVTRVVELSDRTRHDNAPYFAGGAVPARAITQGIDTIMRARSLVVIATGAAKAPVVAAMLAGVVTSDVPATFLTEHPDLTVVVDPLAAGSLPPA